ncbi:hypothetical protein KDL44_09410 [bacterium]|nr:hypothetical protein [bacterium]
MSPFTEDDFMDNTPRTRDSELRGRMEGLRDERERLAPGESQLFENVLERYLEGELNYDEAGMFVADMDLDESQERVWQSLRNLEDTLIIRADVASQLDWLSQRVREAVENNEQLRHWLREISRGVLTFHVWQGHDEYQSLIKCTRLAYIGKYLGVSGGVAVLRSDIS